MGTNQPWYQSPVILTPAWHAQITTSMPRMSRLEAAARLLVAFVLEALVFAGIVGLLAWGISGL